MTDSVQTPSHIGDPIRALEAALEAARLANPVVTGPHGARHVMLPRGFTLADVSDRHALPPDAAATVTVDDRDSLTAYVKRFQDGRAVILADLDAGVIAAAIDWHSPAGTGEPAAPGPRKHWCKLALRPSEEFARWDAMQGELHPQAEFAAFLEENAEDVVAPEAATMIEISRDLEATQGVVFKGSTRLESGDRAFTYETETKVKGDIRVPREFMLAIPLYHGEEPVDLRCALRFRVTPSGLMLGFEWRRVAYQRQATFRALAYAASEATGAPVYFGRTG